MGRTLVIAEPGCTAEGDYASYVKLIHVAADAGADVFKPQWTSNPERMCERRHIGLDHAQYGYYRQAYGWLSFPVEWHHDFKSITTERGLQYACTVFLPEDVKVIAPLVDYLKISSFEGDREMLAAVKGVPRVLMSTGTRSFDECMQIETGEEIQLLHCVTAYPAPLESLNLCVLNYMDGTCPYAGYSDHSRDVRVGGWAVMADARILETHYRLHECSPLNPDYPAALTPSELAEYVANVRDAERAKGRYRKIIQPCEEWALPYRVVS